MEEEGPTKVASSPTIIADGIVLEVTIGLDKTEGACELGEEEVPVTMLPTCYHIDIGVVKLFNLKPQLIDKPPDRLEGRGGLGATEAPVPWVEYYGKEFVKIPN